MSHPGIGGGIDPTEEWSHVSIEEVSVIGRSVWSMICWPTISCGVGDRRFVVGSGSS
jgi:hypothetical protein